MKLILALLFVFSTFTHASLQEDIKKIAADISTLQPEDLQGKSYKVEANKAGNYDLLIKPASAFNISKLSGNKFLVKVVRATDLYLKLQNGKEEFYYPNLKNGTLEYSLGALAVEDEGCIVETSVYVNGEVVYLEDSSINYNLYYDHSKLEFLYFEKTKMVFRRLSSGQAKVVVKMTSDKDKHFYEEAVSKPLGECTTKPDLPVNGGWSPWTKVGSCSKECGYGEQVYVRECNNPVPQNSGEYCQGKPAKIEACMVKTCAKKKYPLTEKEMQLLRRNMSYGLGNKENTRGRKMQITEYSLNIRNVFSADLICDASVESGYFKNQRSRTGYTFLDAKHHSNVFIPKHSSTLVEGKIKMRKNDTYWVKTWVSGFWLSNCVLVY